MDKPKRCSFVRKVSDFMSWVNMIMCLLRWIPYCGDIMWIAGRHVLDDEHAVASVSNVLQNFSFYIKDTGQWLVFDYKKIHPFHRTLISLPGHMNTKILGPLHCRPKSMAISIPKICYLHENELLNIKRMLGHKLSYHIHFQNLSMLFTGYALKLPVLKSPNLSHHSL